MKSFSKLSDDYFKLFVEREGKVVLGKKYSTLWLLTAVLTATFLAIAFSNASMRYLSDKMNDPFIRWMDIPNQQEGRFSDLMIALEDHENKTRFNYESFQADYYQAYMFFGAEQNHISYLRVRFFENIHTELMQAILNEDNIVDPESFSDVSMLPEPSAGVIITADALAQMGYEKTPSYIDIQQPAYDADTLGVKLTSDGMAHVPLPVLAVVKRLPSGMDMVASEFLFVQDKNDNTYPFNLNNPGYVSSLHYFVPKSVDQKAFNEFLEQTGNEKSTNPVLLDDISFWKPEITPMHEGDFISLQGEVEPIIPMEASEINETVLAQWADKGVYRVYDYDFSPYDLSEKSYISVYFNNLNQIRNFETWVNDEYHIKIDMSQVNSKENFNAVSIMASILSWAIIIFAIVCIILFIVNLLQSYFQKVKKNLGTFKAFGVSNRQLIRIYVLIVGVIVLASVLLAVFVTLFAQEALNICGIMKDGSYGYLSLLSLKTLIAIVIILTISIGTVYFVMRKLLQQTPGDLIYDR